MNEQTTVQPQYVPKSYTEAIAILKSHKVITSVIHSHLEGSIEFNNVVSIVADVLRLKGFEQLYTEVYSRKLTRELLLYHSDKIVKQESCRHSYIDSREKYKRYKLAIAYNAGPVTLVNYKPTYKPTTNPYLTNEETIMAQYDHAVITKQLYLGTTRIDNATPAQLFVLIGKLKDEIESLTTTKEIASSRYVEERINERRITIRKLTKLLDNYKASESD